MDKHGIICDDPSSPTTSHSRNSSFYGGPRDVSPQDGFLWPDIHAGADSSNNQGNDYSHSQNDMYRTNDGQFSMDFSLSHFIRTVSSQQPSPPASDIGSSVEHSLPPNDNWQMQWQTPDQQPPIHQWNLAPNIMFQPQSSSGVWTGV